MLIGLRFLLLFAVMGASITLLGYLFTKNPRFLAAAKMIIKVTLAFAALIAVIYLVERLLFI
ncbi:MAG: hypothetical protein ING75_12040 [Rhodocyclaceae bacterium]|nr:hypothetical protein [Rhodocyclaceae bacterium]